MLAALVNLQIKRMNKRARPGDFVKTPADRPKRKRFASVRDFAADFKRR